MQGLIAIPTRVLCPQLTLRYLVSRLLPSLADGKIRSDGTLNWEVLTKPGVDGWGSADVTTQPVQPTSSLVQVKHAKAKQSLDGEPICPSTSLQTGNAGWLVVAVTCQ